MHNKSMVPFSYQEKTWKSYAHGHSGMVVAPTGFGKTFSVFLAVLIDFMNRPEKYPRGLKLLWITPLRSLSKDIARAMQMAIDEIGLDWTVGLRNGDVSQAEKQRQNRNMPDVLVITPESLHLLLSQKAKTRFFKNLKCIAVDEWHELLGSKRGVMVELAIAHLRGIASDARVWGLTATIGNLDQALEVLVPRDDQRKKIVAKEKKKTEILSVFPDELEILPWAGHMGSKMVNKILPIIAKSKTTLIFTNTRAQAETWYMNLLEADPALAGQIAIHHSSIDAELRIWIEENIASGYLKAVVSTSSLDLGVDFKPVDTVIQIGSSKGIARFLQRAGRSGHSPFETSRIYFVPTHSLELIEAAALKEAHKLNSVENREPLFLSFDVLVQFMVTLAVGEGFYPDKLKKEVKSTFAFSQMTDEEWAQALSYITTGGSSLQNYEEFHKVVRQEDGLHKVTSRRVAMLHRMNMGAIVSDRMMRVKFYSGGYIGMIEEYFITRLQKGDAFLLAGRVLELVKVKESDALVKLSKKKNARAVSYMGGRMPLTSWLSHFLRKKVSGSLQAPPREKELRFLRPLLDHQHEFSHIPSENEFLVEMIENKYGNHLFFYPFEGRLVHEVMAALIAWRISQMYAVSFSMAMNDYGFELVSETPLQIGKQDLESILSKENLFRDVISSINATEMARRKFRDIAVISGLVIQNFPSVQHKFKNLQASSNLIFKVLEEHVPDHFLIRQAYTEVFNSQIEEARLREAFNRIANSRIIFRKTERFTPLSFPIKVDSMRQSLSSEDLISRIERMKQTMKRQKKTRKKLQSL
ncbi:MAG: ligase-associated DNA damage response DEXH box helicase [Bacteroidetes bacterium]|nr:MAG: ligase-associated DNA damage response DEXH box helicase [Bacteroidota bacterium]